MPRFRVTYTSRKRVFHTEEKRSEIIEAPNLKEAEAIGHTKLGDYPSDWTVSVEEMAKLMPKFKITSSKANEIADNYPNAHHFLKPVYIDYIMELVGGKGRGTLSFQEWSMKVQKKYCDEKWVGKNNLEKSCEDFQDIANRLAQGQWIMKGLL